MGLLKNAVRCDHCNIVIESTHRHDFKSCLCDDEEKQIFVDGGLDYKRRLFGSKASWKDLSEYSRDDEDDNDL
ncbi:hypothetical protein CL620_06160 [archaeon]|jgi:hypothetical protein|nr:hypothetical protein [archaeon]|tara:strand:- start:245 stop:463 length:219 start_codon:yes stop_codon:yes gene_type:complete